MTVKALVYAIIIIVIIGAVTGLCCTIKTKNSRIDALNNELEQKNDCITKAKAEIESLQKELIKEQETAKTHAETVVKACHDYQEKIEYIEKESQNNVDLHVWLEQSVPDAVLYCSPTTINNTRD